MGKGKTWDYSINGGKNKGQVSYYKHHLLVYLNIKKKYDNQNFNIRIYMNIDVHNQ